MSRLLVNKSTVRALLTDTDDAYLLALRSLFARDSRVDVQKLQLPDIEAARSLRGIGFDTVVALNVLEHIDDDFGALKSIAAIPRAGGRVILLVPALPMLHGSLDIALSHFRRYTPDQLKALFRQTGIQLDSLSYFNVLGAVGWFINSRIFKASRISRTQLRIFDRLVPLLRYEDRLSVPIGQSLIAVGTVL